MITIDKIETKDIYSRDEGIQASESHPEFEKIELLYSFYVYDLYYCWALGHSWVGKVNKNLFQFINK